MIQGRPRNKISKRKRLKNSNNNNESQKFNFLTPSIDPNTVDLPEDLVFSEVLTRLPVKSLTQLKSASKRWQSVISSTQFIKSHVERTNSNPFVPSDCVFIKSGYCFYILNYAAYDRCPDDNRGEKGLIPVRNLSYSDNCVNTFLIGSFNGLVCFGRIYSHSSVDYHFNVCNPIMGQCHQVSDPLGNFGGKLIYGFGFVSSKDDYRLFVGGLQRRSSENFVYVYSLRSKEWKKIGAFDEGKFSILWGGRGVLVNETLHWDISQVWTSSFKKCICAFDLVDETFKYVPLPKAFVGNGHYLEFSSCEMGGSLCLWAEGINGEVEMWVLKQYGAWDSWMKLFKSDMMPGLGNFYGCTENGKVLAQTDEGSLLLVDPGESLPKYTSLVKDLGDIEIVSYVMSPVSPLL